MFQLAKFHGIVGRESRLYEEENDDDEEKNITAIQRFGGILAKQLVMRARGLNERRDAVFRARMNCLGGGMGAASAMSQDTNDGGDDEEEEEEEDSITSISAGGQRSTGDSVIDSSTAMDRYKSNDRGDESELIQRKNNKRKHILPTGLLLDSCTDRLGNIHQAVKNPWKVQMNGGRAGKRYTPSYRCCMDGCSKMSRSHCYQCNKSYCFKLTDDNTNDGMTGMVIASKASCFHKHVREIRRTSRR